MDFLNDLIPKTLNSTVVSNVTDVSNVTLSNVKDKFLNAVSRIQQQCILSIEKQSAFVSAFTLDDDIISDFYANVDAETDAIHEIIGDGYGVIDYGSETGQLLIQYVDETIEKYDGEVTITTSNGLCLPLSSIDGGVDVTPELVADQCTIKGYFVNSNPSPTMEDCLILVFYVDDQPVKVLVNNYFKLGDRYIALFDILHDQQESLNLNVWVKDLTEAISNLTGEDAALVSILDGTNYGLSEDQLQFANQLKASYVKGGVLGLAKAVCSLYKLVNTTEEGDETFSFTNNQVYLPTSFLAGMLTGIIDSVVTVASTILTVVYAPIGIVVGLLGSAVSVISKIFSSTDKDEFLSLSEDIDAYYDYAPTAYFQDTLDPTTPITGPILSSTPYYKHLTDLLNLYNNGVRILVPGGYVILGVGSFDSNGLVSIIKLEFHPYVSKVDNCTFLYSFFNSGWINLKDAPQEDYMRRILFTISINGFSTYLVQTKYTELLNEWKTRFQLGTPDPEVTGNYAGYYHDDDLSIRKGIIENIATFGLWILYYNYLNHRDIGTPLNIEGYFYIGDDGLSHNVPQSFFHISDYTRDYWKNNDPNNYNKPWTWIGFAYDMLTGLQLTTPQDAEYTHSYSSGDWCPGWGGVVMCDALGSQVSWLWAACAPYIADDVDPALLPCCDQPIQFAPKLKSIFNFPKYATGSALVTTIFTAYVAIVTTVTTAYVSYKVINARKHSRLMNQARTEGAWTKLAGDPTEENAKAYYKAVKKNNIMSHLNGGSRIGKTNYWATSSSNSLSESLKEKAKSYATSGKENDPVSLDQIYGIIRGFVGN